MAKALLKGERFVGYGSLMSAEGLGPQLEHVLDARPFRIDCSRRFGKPSQRGGCLAMDVVIDAATVSGATLGAADPATGVGCEGLMITVRDDGHGPLVRREGYSPRCWGRVRAAAGSRTAAEFLLGLAEDAGDDVLAYREALNDVAGASTFTASHYLPHPVRCASGAAVIFVAPAVGKTGVPGIDSAKAAYPALTPRDVNTLFTLDDTTYPGFDPVRQRWYAELCLRAAAHGVWIADLVPTNSKGAHSPLLELLAAWRADPTPLRDERARFAAIPALADPAAYAQRCGDSLESALERSGLFSC